MAPALDALPPPPPPHPAMPTTKIAAANAGGVGRPPDNMRATVKSTDGLSENHGGDEHFRGNKCRFWSFRVVLYFATAANATTWQKSPSDRASVAP
ncbi:MAG: hypothetical protein ACREFQ_11830 [Stellaceae bacterium]